MRDRFEYYTYWVSSDPEHRLNELAADGWRLHSIIPNGENSDGDTQFMLVMERPYAGYSQPLPQETTARRDEKMERT